MLARLNALRTKQAQWKRYLLSLLSGSDSWLWTLRMKMAYFVHFPVLGPPMLPSPLSRAPASGNRNFRKAPFGAELKSAQHTST